MSTGQSHPQPRQCAGIILQDEKGRILLVKQAYKLRLWGVPGGVVDPGETPHQAAVREAMEEIGVTAQLTGIIGTYLLTGGGWPDIQAYMFTARMLDGTPHIVNQQEIERMEWHALHDLPSPMLPDVEAALHDLKTGQKGIVRTVQRQLDMSGVPLSGWTGNA